MEYPSPVLSTFSKELRTLLSFVSCCAQIDIERMIKLVLDPVDPAYPSVSQEVDVSFHLKNQWTSA